MPAESSFIYYDKSMASTNLCVSEKGLFQATNGFIGNEQRSTSLLKCVINPEVESLCMFKCLQHLYFVF